MLIHSRFTRAFSRRNFAAAALVAAMAAASPAVAQEHNERQKLEASRQRVHEMLQAAERAQHEGNHERAEALHREATHLLQRLERAMAEQHRAEDRRRQAEEREHAERGHDRDEREHAREREHAEGGDADRHRTDHGDRAGPREILGGLRQGIWALQQMGREEEARHLIRLAEEYMCELEQRGQHERERAREGERRREGDRRREGEGADREREVARRQLIIYRYAVEGLVKAGRHDAADLVERAEHAQRLNLDGVRNEKAARVRENSPNRETLVKLLTVAAEELADQGRGERAGAVAELARAMNRSRQTDRVPQSDRRRETDRRRDSDRVRETDRARESDRPRDTDRRRETDRDRESDRRRATQREGAERRVQIAKRQIEIMQLALPALREGERKDLAEQIVKAIRVRQVNLERRDGKEADQIREHAPSLGNTIEILNYAAKLWDGFGNKDKAGLLRELARSMQPRRDERREHDSDRQTDRRRSETDRRERDDR